MSTCDIREVLDLVTDKWSLFVVSRLGEGPLRFGELRRSVEGVTQRMLTLTLRRLERDGILTRTVLEPKPLQVAYELTALGQALLEAAGPLIAWSGGNLGAIAAARAEYDRRAVVSADLGH